MKKMKVGAVKNLKWQRYIKYFIWVLVIFWSLAGFRAFSLAAKVNGVAGNQPSNQEIQQENFATSAGARTFATNFSKEYFTWKKEDYQEREERMKRYLREGLDSQAGLRFDTLTANSSFQAIELWNVEDTGKVDVDGKKRETALYTFKVWHKIESTKEIKDSKGKVTKKAVTEGPFEKWIKVSVITDGKGFMINSIPTFTTRPEKAEIEPINSTQNVVSMEPETVKTINDFLNTFFKQYSIGTKEELEYLVQDKDIKPLGNSIIFKEIIETKFIENKEDKKDQYTLLVTAVFIDDKSKTQFQQNFKIRLSKENDRYQVIKFN